MKQTLFPELEGKVVLVTGATKGIGKVIAEAFAAQKSAIAVTGRDKKAGKEAADGLLKRGATSHGTTTWT